MYRIVTFLADDVPTKYKKPADRGRDGPPGGGPPMPVGRETTVEYEDYDVCYKELVTFSKIIECQGKAMPWLMHKMYRDGKGMPVLLHYIDNNYPGIALVSKA